MVNSTGATARSWNRSTEKVARPVGEASRFCAARTGTTIAVEDSASATPTKAAGAGSAPSAKAIAPSTAAQATTCSEPRPKTRRRNVHRRSQDSSMPIMNRRNTTPNSARCAISWRLPIVIQDSHGAWPTKRPRPSGPSSTPAPRKPSTGLILRRRNNGTTTPAVARKRITSL